MTGGCSNDCTRANDVDSRNIFNARTSERLASSNITGNISSKHVNIGLLKGWSRATDGILTRPIPPLSTVSQMRKARSQIRPSRPDRKLVHEQPKEDINQISGHLSKHFQCSVTLSEPKLAHRNLPAMPKKSVAEIPSIWSASKSPKKEKSSDSLQAHKTVAKSLPVKPSVNTSTAKISRRTGTENHNDKSPKAQHGTTIRSNDYSALQRKTNRVEKNLHVFGSTRNQKMKVPNWVEGEKIKSTPLASQSKASASCVKTSKYEENQVKKLNDNVVVAQDLVQLKDFESESLVRDFALSDISEDSDDFDDTLGIICPLCENDLMYSPLYDEFEPSNLPEVAVLYCGHAFHSRCLEDIIPPEEKCRDPPCYFCLTNID
ncbi:hypothetical protein Leryth_013407 [Lithospermum erythrorhizon]|nr:hypothetical protein Leryth_013407 [Lithospermum erythrorhizon]